MKKNHKNYYSNIKGIDELARQKKILEKKIKIRERLLNKHIKDLNDDFSGDYLYRQSIKTLKLDNSLLNIIPSFIKGNMNKKSFIIPAISGIGAALASVFLFKPKTNPPETKTEN
ncbi:MAG: hypothetical protein JXR68_13550 [Bacteroidales bacterium]|nr:hypothetical protein [Bacteroidales bacterium]